MRLLFISCSSVSRDTLISPITSKISDTDGPTVAFGCGRDDLVLTLFITLTKLMCVRHSDCRSTDRDGQGVQSRIQDEGELRQQHLPQHDGAAAVSGQITLKKGHQLVDGEILQLFVENGVVILSKHCVLGCNILFVSVFLTWAHV